MKADAENAKTEARYRRYSDHPVVREKLAKAKEILAKSDLTFLKTPPRKNQ